MRAGVQHLGSGAIEWLPDYGAAVLAQGPANGTGARPGDVRLSLVMLDKWESTVHWWVPVLLMMIFILLVASTGAFWAVVIALILYNGTLIGEALRAGLVALPRGQRGRRAL